jgi:predicted peroxiredoxin
MVLKHFGKEIPYSELESLSGKKKDKVLYTIQIATVAASLGFEVKFFSKKIGFNEENLNLDFYKKYSSEDERSFNEKLFDAKKAGVEIKERSLELKEFLSYLDMNSVIIVLLDWNIINKKEGYQGHFVVLTGYDKENIYLNVPSSSGIVLKIL